MEYGRPLCCKFFVAFFSFLFVCFGGGDFIYLFMKLYADVGHLYHCMIRLVYVLLPLLLDVKPEILKPSHMINGGVYGKYIVYRLWRMWYETYDWSEWLHQEFRKFRKTLKLLLTISETLAYTWEFSSLFTGNSFSVSKIRLRLEVT